METLILRFKSKKNYRLIKELASRLEEQEGLYSKASKEESRKQLPKSKFKSEEHFLSYAGSMKGQYVSKQQLRNRVWKKRV